MMKLNRMLILWFFTLPLLYSCGSTPLTLQITPDGKSFTWNMHGQEVDPAKEGISWKMNYDQWDKSGMPIQGQGTATVKDSKNSYDVLADFTLDEKGYKHIKLTASGGTLSNPISAEASRP